MSSPNVATLPSRYSAIDTAIPLSDIEDLDIRGWRRNKDTSSRIVGELWARFQASYDESRQIRQYDWRRNWEFASGNQWIEWNSLIPDWTQVPVPDEMRFTENQFRGTMRQGINMQVQGDPAYDALPATTDWAAHVSCSVAKPYLYKKARDFSVGRLRVQNIQDAILYGFGVRKMYWQPQGGRVDVKYKVRDVEAEEAGELPEDDALYDGDGIAINKQTGEPRIEDIHYMGKMCMEAVSPWSFFPQTGLDDPYIDNMEWCMDATWVSPAWIARAFPGAGDITLDTLQKQYAMPYQLQQPGDLNWGILGQTQNRRPPQGKVLMITYYQRPSPVRGFERGIEMKWVSNNLLYVGPLQTSPEKPPYDAPLPFSIYVCDTRRGTFYPRPLASDWVEPQMRINQILSDQFQFADLCLRPNLITHQGDRAPDTASFGFNKWEIAGTRDPGFLVPPGVPQELFGLKADAQNALDRVAMQFGATRGERSSQDPSGYYLDVLREHDQIDLQAPIRDQARAEEVCGDILLRLAKRFEPDDQWLEVVGENGKEGYSQFTKDKLDPYKCNIVVQVTSLMPFLSASRRRAGLEVYEKGLLGAQGQVSPRTTRNLIRWMDQPDLFRTLNLDDDDELLASRNHNKIIFEDMIPIPDGMEPGDTEGVDPQTAMQLRDMMVAQGKAFIVDEDWDPNPLLELAIERKKRDDWDKWPEPAKGKFDQYIMILKQTQQEMVNMEKQTQLADQRAMLQLQAEFEDSKQQSQAKGRAQRDIVNAAAKAAITPTPDHQARQDAAVQVVKGFAQHLFKWTLAHEPGGRSGQPGGREAHDIK